MNTMLNVQQGSEQKRKERENINAIFPSIITTITISSRSYIPNNSKLKVTHTIKL